MRNVFRSLNQIYYLIYTLIILMTITGYFMNMNNLLSVGISEQQQSVVLAIQTVFTALAVISFVFFLLKNDKFVRIADLKQRSAIYFKVARMRLILIGLSLFVGVVCLYAIRSEMAIYQIGIVAVLLLVSKPNESRINELLEKK